MPKTPRKAEIEPVKEIKKSKKGYGADVPVPNFKVKDVPQNVMEFEEKESELRSGEEDLKMFKDTCSEIRQLMSDILQLKCKPKIDEKTKKEINDKRIAVSLQFVTLKKLNRLDKLRLKKARDTTHDAKQRVDTFHLQLENLLYEVFHLQKEVVKCLEFKSKDEDVELVPVEEFYKEAPSNIARVEVTQNDKHKLTLARLEWEFEQRKRLSEQCRTLEQTREKISSQIATKQKNIENLIPRLNAILEATRPLQEELNLPLEDIKFQKELAALLPDPLYILYSQIKAYLEACDPSLRVHLEGDMEEARTFGSKLKYRSDELCDEVESESEPENDEENDKRAVTTSGKKPDSIVVKHPLRVKLDVEPLTVSFSFLVNLNVVIVDCSLPGNEDMSSVLVTDNLLSALFPDDYGDETPNLANYYQFKNMSNYNFSHMGKPYHWAQRLGGMDVIGDIKSVPKCLINSNYVGQIIKAIKNRVKCRFELGKLLKKLESGEIPIKPELNSVFPPSVASQLLSWSSADYEDCQKENYAKQLFSIFDISPKNALLFKAVFYRGTAKLNSVVVIPMDYPHSSPLFALELDWHGKHNRENNEDVRSIEAEVNVYWDELPSQKTIGLLAEQMKRLTVCLDLITEIDGKLYSKGNGSIQQESNPEFGNLKMIPQLTKSKDRTKPFRYDWKTGFFLHR